MSISALPKSLEMCLYDVQPSKDRFGLSMLPTTDKFNVNLDEVDFNKIREEQRYLPEAVQPDLWGGTQSVQLPLFPPEFPPKFHPEPEEEEQEVPEGAHRYFVYAWRWHSDKRFAKIGRTRNGLTGVKNRMVTTYNATDDPVLLGVRKCADMAESKKTEKYILDGLKRKRRDREWVEIDDVFNEMIEKSFIKPKSDELKKELRRYKTPQP